MMILLITAVFAQLPPVYWDEGYPSFSSTNDVCRDMALPLNATSYGAFMYCPVQEGAWDVMTASCTVDTTRADWVPTPLNADAITTCQTWALSLGDINGVNIPANPMNQQALACAVYHCMEVYYNAPATTIGALECLMPWDLSNTAAFSANGATGWQKINILGQAAVPGWNFPNGQIGDMLSYPKAECDCNAKLAVAAPSPTHPQWLVDTGTTQFCTSKMSFGPKDSMFFGCGLLDCMPDGDMKDYLYCTYETYYNFEGLADCEKLEKAIIANLGAASIFGILGLVFFTIAIIVFSIVTCCKKNYLIQASNKVGV